ncbi:hypothetical protein L5515_009678 [Caenorhabditis briggsae]|uniref:Uncharacterized protein n=1 Tax=Caenorhabditis briggsae TaxID=6238 RepID=A0AAE9JMK5_CAEBR|nr:hypothetical protein L5515_009678 [Caenorhabditis briggsae]
MTESEENLMGMEELQQFIQGPDDFPILEDSRSRMTSFSESSAAYLSGIEQEERLFALAALYTDQVINLNMRRRITYTDHLLGSVFDGPCVCPYEKCDLKLFDHRTYRQKNRSDYTMILDYINRFPDFLNLSKYEKFPENLVCLPLSRGHLCILANRPIMPVHHHHHTHHVSLQKIKKIFSKHSSHGKKLTRDEARSALHDIEHLAKELHFQKVFDHHAHDGHISLKSFLQFIAPHHGHHTHHHGHPGHHEPIMENTMDTMLRTMSMGPTTGTMGNTTMPQRTMDTMPHTMSMGPTTPTMSLTEPMDTTLQPTMDTMTDITDPPWSPWRTPRTPCPSPPWTPYRTPWTPPCPSEPWTPYRTPCPCPSPHLGTPRTP